MIVIFSASKCISGAIKFCISLSTSGGGGYLVEFSFISGVFFLFFRAVYLLRLFVWRRYA
jgi:hypothetical protein